MTQYELYHHGIKGMKWGKRKAKIVGSGSKSVRKQQTDEEHRKARREKLKKAAKIGAVAAGTALAAYGAYKFHKFVRSRNHDIGMAKAREILGDVRRDAPLLDLYGRVKYGRNAVNREIYKQFADAAASDSFGAALKNVIRGYRDD